MARLIDSNVAIHLRDGDEAVIARLDALPSRPLLSVVSQVELEGGVYARPDRAAMRRAALDHMLAYLDVLPFGSIEARAYGAIVGANVFSRRKIIDRMIAATALVHRLTLVTMNASDFREVPDLMIDDWSEPQ